MNKHRIAILALVSLTVACGSPLENASSSLIEQVRLGDPLANQTYTENREILESPEALPIWIEAIGTTESPAVTEWSARILGNIGDESALEALAQALSNTNRDAREAVVDAIRQFEPMAAAGAFASAVENGSRDARMAALSQLSRLGADANGAVPAVASAARGDDGFVSTTAINALADIGSQDASAALAGIVTDTGAAEKVRMDALAALGRVEADHASSQLDAIITALEGSEDETSTALVAAARALR